MQIEHDIIEFVPQSHLIELFRRFVTAAAELAGASPEAVGRVVICSEQRYGADHRVNQRGSELHK